MLFLKLFGFRKYASLIEQIVGAVENLATGQSAPFDARFDVGPETVDVQGTITVKARVPKAK